MLLSLVFASAALACIDPASKPIPNPYEALRSYESASESFGACLDKLAREGVDLHRVSAWRKDRRDGSVSPVVYTITVQGNDQEGKPAVLAIEYDLSVHRFVCGKLSHNLVRCEL